MREGLAGRRSCECCGVATTGVTRWRHEVASREGTVSVPAVQPHGQDGLHPWGGHTGGPVRILEALRGAVIGHRQLALLGGQVLPAATEGPDQDGHRQEKEGAPRGHNVIPVDGQGRHRNASPWLIKHTHAQKEKVTDASGRAGGSAQPFAHAHTLPPRRRCACSPIRRSSKVHRTSVRSDDGSEPPAGALIRLRPSPKPPPGPD
ncbi:hypothetical protein EYF80_038310 [Liparis tanakae]|uniref:Uncharacterized protein n=1 Tax=Liparis tanakae TaxID=230148 RepID=A0A4Z2GDW3_9TELE|nr:hypothetical protein EYF80_038310 [Liparis tanakae]